MARHVRWMSPIVFIALVAGSVTSPQTPPEIRWRPVVPIQGSLVVLSVRSTGTGTLPLVTGTLAGEPLHFEADTSGAIIALGAIPLDAEDTIPLQVWVNGEETVVPLPVARRVSARERLRTAPQFTRPPDSTLAARLARESRRVRDALAQTHATPKLWTAPFARPRDALVRSGFGLEREYNRELESRHMGADFAGRRGAPVRATNRGVVTLVADLFYAGRTIYIDHGAGLLTAYLHLDRALVSEGDTVQRGQVIGKVGASGRVTGPHLHWLARYGAILVDPLDLLTLEWVATP